MRSTDEWTAQTRNSLLMRFAKIPVNSDEITKDLNYLLLAILSNLASGVGRGRETFLLCLTTFELSPSLNFLMKRSVSIKREQASKNGNFQLNLVK